MATLNKWFYTQKNIFEIVLNKTEIRLYLPFSDLFRIEFLPEKRKA